MGVFTNDRRLILSRKKEGPVARMIEKGTARVPSDIYLWAAGGAMIASAILQYRGRHDPGRRTGLANFVGQWAPSILIMGVYNKLVKQLGHD